MNQTSLASLVVPVLPARLAELAQRGAGAALDHALQHRGDLVGGHRVDDLLAAFDDRRLALVVPRRRRRSRRSRAGRGGRWSCRSGPARGRPASARPAGRRWRTSRRPRPCAERGLAGAERHRRAPAAGPRRRRSARRTRRPAACRRPGRGARSSGCATARGRCGASAARRTPRVVLRLPERRPGPGHLDRRVDHDRRRRVAVVERRGVDERLERRAGLAQRLGGAVELARR